jgi:hypothetical protein
MTTAGSISPSAVDYVQLYSTPLQVKDKTAERPNQDIVFRIYIRQENDELNSVRFQISKDSKLDYLYEATYDKTEFEAMKSRQHLDLEFEDFPSVVRQQIIDVLRKTDFDDSQRSSADSMKEPRQAPFKVVLAERDEGEPDEEEDGGDDRKAPSLAGSEEEEVPSTKYFIVYQKLEFCRAQVFKFLFTQADSERTAEISQARYDELMARLKAVETDYKDAYKRVHRTSPNILKTFKPDDDTT